MKDEGRKPVSILASTPGVSVAIAAAVLFGASTPVSKILLGRLDPILLAGLLYLGSGVGLTLWRLVSVQFKSKGSGDANLKPADLPWLAGAILSGGIVGPVASTTHCDCISFSGISRLRRQPDSLFVGASTSRHREDRSIFFCCPVHRSSCLASSLGR